MLTQRTNVLFTPDEHQALTALSRAQRLTMGELIRRAVRKVYKIEPEGKRMSESLARVARLTKNITAKGIDYRELVTSGRKHEDI